MARVCKANRINNFDFDTFDSWREGYGIPATRISEELGYSSSYYSYYKKIGYVSREFYNKLCKKYDLPNNKFLKNSDISEDDFIDSLTEDQKKAFFAFIEREKEALRKDRKPKKAFYGVIAARGSIFKFNNEKSSKELALVVSANSRSADKLVSVLFLYPAKDMINQEECVATFTLKGEQYCVNCDLVTYTRREFLTGDPLGYISDSGMEKIDEKLRAGLGL